MKREKVNLTMKFNEENNLGEFPSDEMVYQVFDQLLLSTDSFARLGLKEQLFTVLEFDEHEASIQESEKAVFYYHAIYILGNSHDLLKYSSNDIGEKNYTLTKNGLKSKKLGKVSQFIKEDDNPPFNKKDYWNFGISGIALIITLIVNWKTILEFLK